MTKSFFHWHTLRRYFGSVGTAAALGWGAAAACADESNELSAAPAVAAASEDLLASLQPGDDGPRGERRPGDRGRGDNPPEGRRGGDRRPEGDWPPPGGARGRGPEDRGPRDRASEAREFGGRGPGPRGPGDGPRFAPPGGVRGHEEHMRRLERKLDAILHELSLLRRERHTLATVGPPPFARGGQLGPREMEGPPRPRRGGPPGPPRPERDRDDDDGPRGDRRPDDDDDRRPLAPRGRSWRSDDLTF